MTYCKAFYALYVEFTHAFYARKIASSENYMESYKKLIGNKIKKRRIELNILTQEMLAELVEVDQARVSNWETGKNLPDPKYKLKLSKVLKVDPEVFFDTINLSDSRSIALDSILLKLPRLNHEQLLTLSKFINSLTRFGA